MRAAVLAGGRIRATAELKRLVSACDLVLAADSGLHHAQTLEVRPDKIVGDFDSVSPQVLARYADVPRQRHPRAKDQLDLELALDVATREGARELIIVGSLGGRLDQTLATILIAARHKKAGTGVSLHTGNLEVHYLTTGELLELDVEVKRRFSTLSLEGAATVSIFGARFPLKRQSLPFGVGLGVSNEVTASPLTVEVIDGLLAVILERRSSRPRSRVK